MKQMYVSKKPKGKTRANTINHPNKIKVTCPHCGKTGTKLSMSKWHFDKCKTINLEEMRYYVYRTKNKIKVTKQCISQKVLDAYAEALSNFAMKPVIKTEYIKSFPSYYSAKLWVKENQSELLQTAFSMHSGSNMAPVPDNGYDKNYKRVCPKCGRSGRSSSFIYAHFDNCTYNNQEDEGYIEYDENGSSLFDFL